MATFNVRDRRRGQAITARVRLAGMQVARTFYGMDEAKSWADKVEASIRAGDELWLELVYARDELRARCFEILELDRARPLQERLDEATRIIRCLTQLTEAITPRAGVYLLYDDSGRVVYVGQSKNVATRLSGHRDKIYSRVRMFAVGEMRERIRLELRLIVLLRPPLNSIPGVAFAG